MFYLCLIVSSFALASMRHYLRFYLSLFLVHFFSHHWDIIKFYLNLFFVYLVSHHWNAILGSNFLICFFGFLIIGLNSQVLYKVNQLFNWFLIIGLNSQVLYKLNHLFDWSFIIRTRSQVLSKFLLYSFGFIIGTPFYLNIFFVSFSFL